MLSWPAHGSGIIISSACGSERPVMTRNSRTLSNVAVSLPPSRMTGSTFRRSSPSTLRAQQPLAGAHPVDVAGQRVDLAVVRDVAVGVGQRPRRERVRAEALVHERERRLDVGIGQIGKHRLDLIGRQHALVDERVAGEADDVAAPFRVIGHGQRLHRALEPFPDDVQLALEPHARVARPSGRDRGR